MNNYENPKITVLMPVYNCELYITEAIDSVLNQTYSDFEFLIIDDASTDSTVSIIKSYGDNRIKLIEKPLNTGYTNSLNNGLKIAKGEYIARMDGDDISLRERFEKQVAFLDENSEIILCGTLYQIIGTKIICNHPFDHEEIKVKLISGCYIAHPTVMFRKSVFEYHQLTYNPDMEPAEDYDLWSRLAFYGKLANINEVLLNYRVHPLQTSMVRSEKQLRVARQIKIRMLKKLIPSIDEELYFVNLPALVKENKWMDKAKMRIKLLDLLLEENNKKKVYDYELFLKFLNEEKKIFYKALSLKNELHTLRNLGCILFYSPSFFVNISFKSSCKFFIKCFLR